MGIAGDSVDLPIIDISSDNPDAPRQLLDAASRYGFVFVEHNGAAGITPAQVTAMFELSRRFFAAPVEEKEGVSIRSNHAGKNHGWLGQGVEKLDPAGQKRADVKEAFNIGEPNPPGRLQQPLPPTLEPHAATIVAFQSACHALCQKLNALLALALSLDEAWFTSRHAAEGKASSSVFRMLYYPAPSDDYEEGVDVRAGAHSDYGSLTLLFQRRGQPGLEIRSPGSGEWVGVAVDPRAASSTATAGDDHGHGHARPAPIVVNIGDLLEDWTGGLLKSTVHRVVFPRGADAGARQDRYSLAYFCHPLDEAVLEPVPSRLVEEHIARAGRSGAGRAVTAAEHLGQRLRATYSV